MSKNKTTARFFKAVLCTIAFAGCSASGTAQKNGIQAFADKYTAADKSAQIIVRNQEREVTLTEEEFEKEKEAARPKLITSDCSKKAVDAGMKAYYEFETAYRKDMLKVIAEAETEKIDAFTADAMCIRRNCGSPTAEMTGATTTGNREPSYRKLRAT